MNQTCAQETTRSPVLAPRTPLPGEVEPRREDLGQIPRNANICTKVISDEHRLAWIFIPKVGGRTIERVLKAEYGGVAIAQGLDVLYASRPELRGFRKFAFVRSPWARLVSCYKNKIDTEVEKNLGACVHPYAGLYPRMPFNEFVRWICTSEEGSDFHPKANRHWVSQHLFLSGPGGEFLVDRIGKLENMQQDFDEIMRGFGLPGAVLPHTGATVKAGVHGSRNYRPYYDASTARMVAERFREDIEMFEYDF